MKTKKAAHKGATTKERHKDSVFSETKSESFSATRELRKSELATAREWFQSNPDKSISRCDLGRIMNRPANHITRIFDDLKVEGTIVYSHSAPSECSGKKVEYYRFSGREYKPQPKQKPEQKRPMVVTQLKLFDL